MVLVATPEDEKPDSPEKFLHDLAQLTSEQLHTEFDRIFTRALTIPNYDDEEGEYVVYPLPIPIQVDELIHTDAHPICGDPTCFCAGSAPALEVQMLTMILD
jgi:hypothetical protein